MRNAHINCTDVWTSLYLFSPAMQMLCLTSGSNLLGHKAWRGVARCYAARGMESGELTLYVERLSTTHVSTASRPTGTVTLCSGSTNLGTSATERDSDIITERTCTPC